MIQHGAHRWRLLRACIGYGSEDRCDLALEKELGAGPAIGAAGAEGTAPAWSRHRRLGGLDARYAGGEAT